MEGGIIMFGFDRVFDFNNDGQFDSLEKAAQFQFADHANSDKKGRLFRTNGALIPFLTVRSTAP